MFTSKLTNSFILNTSFIKYLFMYKFEYDVLFQILNFKCTVTFNTFYYRNVRTNLTFYTYGKTKINPIQY